MKRYIQAYGCGYRENAPIKAGKSTKYRRKMGYRENKIVVEF